MSDTIFLFADTIFLFGRGEFPAPLLAPERNNLAFRHPFIHLFKPDPDPFLEIRAMSDTYETVHGGVKQKSALYPRNQRLPFEPYCVQLMLLWPHAYHSPSSVKSPPASSPTFASVLHASVLRFRSFMLNSGTTE